VKGKWKQREDSGKNYSGQPEMAHVRRSHNFMRDRRVG
jgi:hypothetical protein